MCSKKLVAIPLWIEHYESDYSVLSPETKQQILIISAPSIDRVLKPVRLQSPRKGLIVCAIHGANSTISL